jgi:hypothetical protein
MEPLTCEIVEAGGLVERYAIGQLSDAEQDAFESHLLLCDRCQRGVLLGAAIRATLPNVPLARRPVRPRVIWWGLGLTAAGVAAILLLPPGQSGSPLRRLGDLTVAPIYLGIPVRAALPQPGDTIFDRAMSVYREEYYGQAIVAMRSALDAGVDPAPAEFFLAASYLMTDRAQAASQGFARVIALGDTPYRSEAHYYRAKALLRLGDAEAALTELARAAGSSGATGVAARALADSVQELLPR